MLTKYTEHPDSATYTWDYAGGCFENGEFARYIPAEIGTETNFNHLPIEIRRVGGDSAEASEFTNENSPAASSKGWSFFSFLATLCLILTLGLLGWAVY